MVHMTSKSLLAMASIIGLAVSYPVRREVPQEHAHEDILRLTNTFLKQNNPNGIVDAVFGLLGNAAASTGQGKITNTDCLQAATADQAFTNAKAAGDIAGMTAALSFRAIERNTGAVGQASVACTGFNFQNPEIAALSQHQDPASANAAAINKKITLDLAKQIAAIGGDPLDALRTGTFAPGQIGDPTARGNSCDDPNDAAGCINTLGLLVEDATPEEIAAAVAGVDTGAGAGNGTDTGAGADTGAGNNAGNDAATPPAGGLAGKNQNVGTCQVAGGGGAVTPPAADDGADVGDDTGDDTGDEVDDGADDTVDDPAETCPPAVTVTVTAGASATEAPSATTPAATEAPATTPPPASTTAAPPATGTGDALAPVNTGNIDFRKCTNPSIIFGAGLDNRKANEFSFLPADLTEFPHGSALNGQIIMQFTCDNLVNRCGFTNADQTVIDCRAAQASLANRQKDPASADVFNAALGFKSNFGSIDVNAPTQAQLTPDVDAAGKPTFRNCKNPSVLFAGGLEGRAATELTFKPADDADFNHGTAKNAQIIYQFICDTLVNKCGFTNADATVIKCRDTQQSLASLGNVGRSADEWNKALGFTTNFAAVDNS